jgi:hypothetical protein
MEFAGFSGRGGSVGQLLVRNRRGAWKHGGAGLIASVITQR